MKEELAANRQIKAMLMPNSHFKTAISGSIKTPLALMTAFYSCYNNMHWGAVVDGPTSGTGANPPLPSASVEVAFPPY